MVNYQYIYMVYFLFHNLKITCWLSTWQADRLNEKAQSYLRSGGLRG